MRTTPTRLHSLIERDLGEPLAGYVATSRAAGMSWRAMADDLHGRTGIQVSAEVLRQWFAHRIQVEVKVA